MSNESSIAPLPDSQARVYEITLDCQLDAHWAEWFEGLTVTNLPEGRAVLRGPIADQTALHGVLMKIRDLGLKLVAVNPID